MTRQLTTSLGRSIRIISNASYRHYTIITESGKYRTTSMSKHEFNAHEYNTANDWQNFLKTEIGSYYTVK